MRPPIGKGLETVGHDLPIGHQSTRLEQRKSRTSSVLAAVWGNTEILVGNANGFEMGRTLRIIIVGR